MQITREICTYIQVNGYDVREATTDEAVRAISSAREPIVVEVLRRPVVSGRRPPPLPLPITTGVMDSEAWSPSDCVPLAMMATTATQTDDCTLDDDEEVDFVDRQYACYEHLSVHQYFLNFYLFICNTLYNKIQNKMLG